MNLYDVQVATQIEALKERGIIVRIPKIGIPGFFIKPQRKKKECQTQLNLDAVLPD